MDKNRHLIFMRKLLREFFEDELLSSELRFKGGTAAMFFEGLPRFSTDLDFNLVSRSKQGEVMDRIVKIMSASGRIIDSADKRFGPVVVLDYGSGDRNLKVEVSNRWFDNHYVLRDFGQMLIPVMSRSDMLTHKLCAMSRRKAPRDVFDVWYFLSKGWGLNEYIIKERTGKGTEVFLESCSKSLSGMNPASMMMEIGELLDDSMKPFVRSGKLISECNVLLEDYMRFPVVEFQIPAPHTELLFRNSSMLPTLMKAGIDPSLVTDGQLSDVLSGKRVLLRKMTGEGVMCQLTGGIVKVGKAWHP